MLGYLDIWMLLYFEQEGFFFGTFVPISQYLILLPFPSLLTPDTRLFHTECG